MDEKRSVVAVASGGLDSITMLYDLKSDGFDISSVVSFNYGQRHNKELQFAALHATALGAKHHIIDLSKSGITEAIAVSGSSLVSDTPVPDGHYAEETMKATVVPNRNMMMLSIAVAVAVAEDANLVATGVHAGDHFIYPDCRPQFVAAAAAAAIYGNEGFGHFEGIVAPYMYSSKADIAFRAFEIGVPVAETWSCYKGGDVHCGRCGTCVERLEAIDEAIARHLEQNNVQFQDYTKYADTEFWRSALDNAPVGE